MLRDRQPPAQRFAEPILQSSISRVGPHQLDGREEMLQTLQQELGSGAIVDVGWMHAVLQQIALRINEKMALAALDLLAAIVPTGPAHLRGLDRLTVDDRGCRLRIAADRAAITLAQNLGHVLPGTI